MDIMMIVLNAVVSVMIESTVWISGIRGTLQVVIMTMDVNQAIMKTMSTIVLVVNVIVIVDLVVKIMNVVKIMVPMKVVLVVIAPLILMERMVLVPTTQFRLITNWCNVVVRITIVWDQDAASLIASEFYFVRLYVVERCCVEFVIDLDQSFVRCDRGSGQLAVSRIGWISEPTRGFQLNPVGAGWPILVMRINVFTAIRMVIVRLVMQVDV